MLLDFGEKVGVEGPKVWVGSAQVRFKAASVWRAPLSADHTVLFETFSLGFSKVNPVLTAGS